MTVRVTLNCQVKSGHIKVLISFLKNHLSNVRSFNGCMSVTIYFDKDNSEMLIEETWLNAEHHQAYIKHIESNGVLSELVQFLELAPVIKYFIKESI